MHKEQIKTRAGEIVCIRKIHLFNSNMQFLHITTVISNAEVILIFLKITWGYLCRTDGSKSSMGMEAGFYRHHIKGGGCCRVGGGVGGGSSGRAEYVAACLTLEDSLTHDQSIVVLTDSKGLMTVASNWVGKISG